MRELAPELMHADKQIYDLPQHTVTVTEINSIDLMNAGGAYLGMNMVCHGNCYSNELLQLHTGAWICQRGDCGKCGVRAYNGGLGQSPQWDPVAEHLIEG